MSVRVPRSTDRAGDLADVWLDHALTCLFDACDLPEGEEVAARSTTAERLDACRCALVFAALALEARLNRALRHCDAAESRAVAHLSPAEKFRLAPRLLGEFHSAAKDATLCDLVVEIFNVRDDLVEAGASSAEALTEGASEFSPSHARALVAASAKLCWFLAALVGEDEGGTARRVLEAADGLALRADLLSAGRAPSLPHWDWDWGGEEFPPDLIGS